MTVTQLLSELRSRDIAIWVEGEKLRYRAPRGVLSEDLRAALVRHKPEVISFLEQALRKPAPLPPASRAGALPLSSAEEGLWLLQQIRPELAAWNMQSGLRIRGALDVAALRSALAAMTERHEALRTSFLATSGQAARIVAPKVSAELEVIDLSGSPDSRAEIARTAAADENEPFDLASGPLWRARLFRTGDLEHVFLWTIHHIVSDSSSNRIFYRDLLELYQAHAQGRDPAFQELPIQYADYAVWQRRREAEAAASHLAYWKNKLEGFVVSEIPADKRRPEQRSYRGAKQKIALGAELTRSLGELCKQERATMFMLLVAAFKILLSRYTGSGDIIVGAATAGRTRPELENLIGMFINLLPLRTDLGGRPSFRELLRRVREVCLQAYEHQDLPFERVVEEFHAGRGSGRNPFFQVLFDVVNLPSHRREIAGLTLEPLPRSEDVARYEIVIRAPQTPAGLEIWIDSCVDLFSAERIAEMLRQYRYLLEQVVQNPEQEIDRYSLWTATARKVLPDPTVPLGRDWQGAVHELFARRAAQAPDKLAVADRHESWSYRDLNRRANQLAHYLGAQGIGRKDIVAICGERSAALVWSILGIFKAGAAYFIVDPSHPLERRQQYLAEVRPKAIIALAAGSSERQEIEAMAARIAENGRIPLPVFAPGGANDFLTDYSGDDPPVTTGADDLACVIFTSGSTGKPKGVLGRHSSLTHFVPWIAQTFEISAEDRFSVLAGLSSNILQREIFTALSLGATLLIPGSSAAARSTQLDVFLRESEITVVHLTPAMAQMIAQTAGGPIPGVRRVFFAGDLLSLRDVEKTRDLMPQADIINFYASSESQRASGYKVFSGKAAAGAKEIPPLGRGVEDVQLLVANARGEMAGVGELGEIWVRSPHLALGYLGDEKFTAEKFIVNPFTGRAGDRIYRTGERGRLLPDGEVEFAGRPEHQASIRGFRIDLSEIECALARHAGVRSAAVAARQDGAEETRLVGYVVPEKEPGPNPGDLRLFLRRILPDYMLPSAFVFLKALPLTAGGKIDRAALPPADQDRPELQNRYVAPRTPVEKILADVWAEILNLKSVGVHDDFFDLGGHSILAVRLVAEVERLWMKNIPVPMPFQAPTVAFMARGIARARRVAPSSLLSIQSGGMRTPLFCVHGSDAYIPLARHLGPDQPLYGLAQHLGGEKLRYATLEDIAAHYIQEMKRVQPAGPYFLAGHWIGGVVALEMARQLRRTGERIDLLALLDPVAPGVAPAGGLLARGKTLYSRLRESIKLPPPRSRHGTDDRLYRRALKRHRPGSYDGRAIFFWSSQRRDSTSRWTALVKSAEVFWTPGDDLFAEPGLASLARQLRGRLEKLQPAGAAERVELQI
jgi:amino acid adenylation domain-containing protein